MSIIIERIIRIEHSESDTFMRLQQRRLQQLREIEQRKQEGKRIRKTRIIKELQNSGILDKNGDLSKHYFELD